MTVSDSLHAARGGDGDKETLVSCSESVSKVVFRRHCARSAAEATLSL